MDIFVRCFWNKWPHPHALRHSPKHVWVAPASKLLDFCCCTFWISNLPLINLFKYPHYNYLCTLRRQGNIKLHSKYLALDWKCFNAAISLFSNNFMLILTKLWGAVHLWCQQTYLFRPIRVHRFSWNSHIMANLAVTLIKLYSNTPGTAGGSGGRDRTLAVKSRKNVR